MSKASRYRAGKVPEYAKESLDNEGSNASAPTTAKEVAPTPPTKEPVIDRRLQRLANRRGDIAEDENERRRRRAREIHEAEVLAEGVLDEEQKLPTDNDEQRELSELVESHQLDDDDNEPRRRVVDRRSTEAGIEESVVQSTEDASDDEDPDARRARLREMMKKREQQESSNNNKEENEEEEEEDEEEDDDDDDEDDEEEEDFRPKFAPVFKRREERTTVSEQAQQELLEEALEREKQKRLEERKQETIEILKQELERKELQQNQEDVGDQIPEDLEDDDDGDETVEYEQWKLRELARIKREREEREKAEQEKAEIERRRNMTDAQIMEEDKERLAPKEKKKMKFLQKYYHKGAYFRSFDEKDELETKWDFMQPTLEDRNDKTILPSVLQVKNFGKKGRTKYTHLKDQDTTAFDSGWSAKESANVRNKLKERMGGMGNVDSIVNKRRKPNT